MLREILKFRNNLIKKFILIWDPDYTKVTFAEKRIIKKTDAEMKSGNYVTEDEVWYKN